MTDNMTYLNCSFLLHPHALLLLLQRLLLFLRKLNLLHRLAISVAILLVHIHLVQLPLFLLLVLLPRWLCFDEREHRFSISIHHHLRILVLVFMLEGELIQDFANRVGIFTRRGTGLEEHQTFFHLLA